MEAKIKARLDEYDLTIEDLTQEEIEQLKEEITAEENGAQFLDGVLSNPEIRFRKERRELEKRWGSQFKDAQ